MRGNETELITIKTLEYNKETNDFPITVNSNGLVKNIVKIKNLKVRLDLHFLPRQQRTG